MKGGILPKTSRIPPFIHYREAKESPDLFKTWIQKERPDAILTLYHSVYRWIEEMGLRIPDDIGFAQLECRAGDTAIAGMDQHNDIAGEAAVDMVISQIHNNEIGIPQFPRSTLVGATWTEGPSIATPR